MGIPVPVEYGGSGSDYLTHIVAVDELARSCASTGFTVSIHVGIACMLVLLFGTEDQKKKFLGPMARGEKLGAFVLTEPGAGTDVMAATTTARQGRERLRPERDQDLHVQRPYRGHLLRLRVDGQARAGKA